MRGDEDGMRVISGDARDGEGQGEDDNLAAAVELAQVHQDSPSRCV